MKKNRRVRKGKVGFTFALALLVAGAGMLAGCVAVSTQFSVAKIELQRDKVGHQSGSISFSIVGVPVFWRSLAGLESVERQDYDVLETKRAGGPSVKKKIGRVAFLERVAFPEHGLVKIPNHLSYNEAATLPCAAVTAWQALTLGNPVPGQTILVLGTGGVSIFALQLAKLYGARVIATSSSDEKLARASLLGADATINYKRTPNWHEEVRRLTQGQGVDNVIEVGGAGTLEKSMDAARVSGRVSLIGVLTGMPEQNPSPLMALFKRLTIQGIYVGSRDMFEAMNRAIESARLHPVIDKTFGFSEVPAAYEHLRSGAHFGKVVIER